MEHRDASERWCPTDMRLDVTLGSYRSARSRPPCQKPRMRPSRTRPLRRRRHRNRPSRNSSRRHCNERRRRRREIAYRDAEIQNARRRAAQERSEAIRYGGMPSLEGWSPCSMMRMVLAHQPESDASDLAMVRTRLWQELEGDGVTLLPGRCDVRPERPRSPLPRACLGGGTGRHHHRGARARVPVPGTGAPGRSCGRGSSSHGIGVRSREETLYCERFSLVNKTGVHIPI